MSTSVEIKEIDPTTAAVVSAAMRDDGDLVEVRLARGCRCFGAWLDGRLAGYGWLSTGREWIGELELEIRPDAGEGYIWNCLTLEPQRRRGVLRSLLAGITARADNEGFTRLWIGSVAIPAERAFGPSGFSPALNFSSELFAGYRWVGVRPVEGADPALVAAAHRVVGVPSGRFLRTSHPRRH